MASCSQYAAAFGYNVFIVPVSACGVDLGSVSGGVKAEGFIDPTTLVNPKIKIVEGASSSEIVAGDAPGANIVFDNDAVTTESVLKLYGLTNAALETDTSSETVTTYDTDAKGFDQNVAVSKSWSISLEGVSQFTDAGYKALRLLEQNAVAGSLKVKIGRLGPTGTTEAIYGYATLTGFSESVEAGSIVSWSVTAEGYGPYAIDLDNSGTINLAGPIDGLTITNAGSNLLDGTFAGIALSGGAGSGATATIVIEGGTVTSVTLEERGSDYAGNDSLAPASMTAAANPNAGGATDATLTDAGSNLADGSFSAEAATGGSGSGAQFDVEVSGGSVQSITLVAGGSGYNASEVLTLDGLAAAANPSAGEILTSSITDAGSGYGDDTYTGVALTGGNGSAAVADIVVTSGTVSSVTITDGGLGYSAGETLSADSADIGGGSGLEVTIDSVDENALLAKTDATLTLDAVEDPELVAVQPILTVASLINDND